MGISCPWTSKIKHDSNQPARFNIMNMHGQSQQRYWLKKAVLLRKHGPEPNVEGQLRDPQAHGHSQATSHWEVSMLECPFRLAGREKPWFSSNGRICSYCNSTCPRLLTVIYGFPATSLRSCKCICKQVGNLKTRLQVLFLFAQKQGNCSFWMELVPWRQEQKYAAQHLEDLAKSKS